jgi:uncharacterized Zn finger protein
MVMAKLHLICGNCGCDDEWEWEYIHEIDNGEYEDNDPEDIYLWCNNCSTLHSINDNAKKKPEED